MSETFYWSITPGWEGRVLKERAGRPRHPENRLPPYGYLDAADDLDRFLYICARPARRVSLIGK